MFVYVLFEIFMFVYYVCSYFVVFVLDVVEFWLKVVGQVVFFLLFLFVELCVLFVMIYVFMLECVGNGWVYLIFKVSGVQWEVGVVGMVQWMGVLL